MVDVPIPPEDQAVVPDTPFTDPNVGRKTNPGDPQPDKPEDNPPNLETRLSTIEQKVNALWSQVFKEVGV